MAMNDAPGLYIHVPFCRSRCGYCTFASTVYHQELADSYLTALLTELEVREVSTPSTLFIGGGTPSVLSLRQLETLLSSLPLPENNGEITCEINPDTASREKLHLLRQYGVNRLSFGVQTFSDDGLRFLGRVHDSRTAQTVVGLALEAGFPSINIDLIHGWPGQERATIHNDIATAAGLGIHHLSNYSLILDENAPAYSVFREKLAGDQMDGDVAVGHFFLVHELLQGYGYDHYETSNFCRPGYQCQHNRNTWRGMEYWGIGLGAHSHLDGRRSANTTDINTYIHEVQTPGAIETFSEKLDPETKARETAVFWLRLYEGICLDEFAGRTGFQLQTLYGDTLKSLLETGLLEYTAESQYLRVPVRHQPILDSILIDLV